MNWNPPDIEYVECFGCHREIAVEHVKRAIDVSREDEYYPKMEPLCPRCADD